LTKPTTDRTRASARDALSAMNALDLALHSQELDAEVATTMRRLLPLLDQIERICRGFDKLTPEACVAKAESVAILADLADKMAKDTGLERFAAVGEAVDGEKHEIVETRRAEADGAAAHGCIVEVVEPGWLHQGLLLRRAKVIVAARS
jgi:molecular chaperone GrpE (heat shock protein)